MSTRLRVGDVVEIRTKLGFSYAQYTHRDARWGHLVRLLPFLFQQRPDFHEEILEEKPLYIIFLPLSRIVKLQIFPVVVNMPIPSHSKDFPIFRSSNSDGENDDWWLYDGKNKWFVGKLENPEEYPELYVCNDTFLIEVIEGDLKDLFVRK